MRFRFPIAGAASWATGGMPFRMDGSVVGDVSGLRECAWYGVLREDALWIWRFLGDGLDIPVSLVVVDIVAGRRCSARSRFWSFTHTRCAVGCGLGGWDRVLELSASE